MGLLPWILVLVGLVFTLINTMAKKSSKVFAYVALVLFVMAGVMFFLMPNFMVFAETVSGLVLKNLKWQLAIGSIIAGVCSIIAGVVMLAGNLKK